MYLKLHNKFSPKRVAALMLPELAEDEPEYGSENVYEWVYIDLPSVAFSLDVTRDHGMSDVDDDLLEKMTASELEVLPSAGPTYIFGWDRQRDVYVEDIPDSVIRLLCARTQTDIAVHPGRIDMDKEDPKPIKHFRYEANKLGFSGRDTAAKP